MATIRYEVDFMRELTNEEIEMVHDAAQIPYVPDDDSPELSEEQIMEFKRIIDERTKIN